MGILHVFFNLVGGGAFIYFCYCVCGSSLTLEENVTANRYKVLLTDHYDETSLSRWAWSFPGLLRPYSQRTGGSLNGVTRMKMM